MKRLLRNITRVMLIMALGVGGLGFVATTAAPVAHAAGPTLYATSLSNGISLYGYGFTDGAPVGITVYEAICKGARGTIPPSTTLPNNGNGVLCGGQTTVHAYEINNRPGEPWQLYDAGAQVFVGE